MAASDARPVPKKNVAFRWYLVILDADGDPVSGAASLDSEVSIDGAAFADCTNEATEIGSTGIYFLDLTSSEMNGDAICVRVQTATAGAKTTVGVFYPEEAGDIRVNVTQISDDATAADNCELMFDGTGYAGGTTKLGVDAVAISGDTTAADNLELFFDGTGYNASNSTVGTVTTVTNAVTANVTQISGDTTAADNLEAEYDGTGFKSYVRRNTAQAGGAFSITLDSGASATDNLYTRLRVTILSGTGAGQSRFIVGYVGSTKVASIEPAWITNPSSDSVFILEGQCQVDLGQWIGVTPVALANQLVQVDVIAISGDATSANNLESYTDGTTPMPVNATQISGDATAADNLELFFDGTGYAASNSTVGTVTTVTNVVSANVTQISGDSVAADNLEAEYDGTGYKSYLRRNTAQAGAASTITLDSGASATDDLYNGQLVSIVSGTGAGQTRLITNYTGSSKVADIAPNWTTNPSSDSVFLIHPFGRVDLALWLGTAPNALVSGRTDASVGAMAADTITASAIATGAIDADAIAADAIGASELATDAVNEIRDAVWAKAMSELASVPGVTGSVLEALEWVFLLARNRVTQTSSTQTLRNDANSANIATAAVSDDGTTFVRAEWA